MNSLSKILVNITQEQDKYLLPEKAIRLAQALSAKIEFFKCGYQPHYSSMNLLGNDILEKLQHNRLRDLEGSLNELLATLKKDYDNLSVDVAWDRGIAEGLLTKVERSNPDLVLHEVAEHPHLLHRLLVPHDWQILRECMAPLMLCKSKPWPERIRIVAAVDPFHAHDHAALMDQKILNEASLLAQVLGAELHIFHSYVVFPQSAIFDDSLMSNFKTLQYQVTSEHQAGVERLVNGFDPTIDASCIHVVEGEVHDVLPDFIKKQEINILVMGSLARGMLDRLLLGSSAERLLDAVACDVLVLKA
ncbi:MULTISPECIES: universal stress protein [Nitrincola]|uniref:Universal stress protein E n=1 Tax=Nitrincola nitratireducens TaxID=1229521 RepID=W9V8E0_9GAMM|nr:MULTISPECIES: universal stress protein [Nitrincola]EXJ13156.1 Universal stress protein E [Nitrincola nitratireducens]